MEARGNRLGCTINYKGRCLWKARRNPFVVRHTLVIPCWYSSLLLIFIFFAMIIAKDVEILENILRFTSVVPGFFALAANGTALTISWEHSLYALDFVPSHAVSEWYAQTQIANPYKKREESLVSPARRLKKFSEY
jgi:hypothetical protein